MCCLSKIIQKPINAVASCLEVLSLLWSFREGTRRCKVVLSLHFISPMDAALITADASAAQDSEALVGRRTPSVPSDALQCSLTFTRSLL